ncbi:MAG: hypothetical protein WCB96_00405 [Candidatus Aminicenantales bacterium]
MTHQGNLGTRLSSLALRSEQTLDRFCQKKAVFAGMAVSAALLTAAAYHLTTKEYPPGSILRVSLGIADFPFQGRILVYETAQFLSRTFSLNLYAVHFLLRSLTIVGILYTLRSLLRLLGFQSSLLPLLFPWATLFSFAGDYSYPTDFPEILAFALMLLLALKSRWLWLLLVFGLSFLNRESAVLFLPFLGLQALRQEKKLAPLACLAIMVLMAVGLRMLVVPQDAASFSLADHPQKLSGNLKLLKDIPLIFNRQQGEAVRFLVWRLLSFSGFLYLALILNKKKIPVVLRRFLVATTPFCLLAGAVVGNLDETRVFYPLLPGLILAAAIFFEEHRRLRRLVMPLVLVLVICFFIKCGLALPKGSEFLVKAAAFRAEEFKHWEKSASKFSSQDMIVQGDRIIINLTTHQKRYYFLDARILVPSQPYAPRPIRCRYFLKNGLSHFEPFWEGRGVLSALGRHIEFEMKNPTAQTAEVEKIMVLFDQDLTGKPLPLITWRGFSSLKQERPPEGIKPNPVGQRKGEGS